MNVLLIGKAKTGTTAGAMAIASALPDCEIVMEPRDLGFLGPRQRTIRQLVRPRRRFQHRVIKILFEHWRDRMEQLRDLVTNRSPLHVDRLVFMTRDPRDELISRLHYSLYVDLLKNPDLDPARIEQWINVMRQKERNPGSLSVLEMLTRYDELIRSSKTPRKALPGVDLGLENFIQDMHAPACRLRYEDFVEGAWDGLASYLGFKPVHADVGESLRRVSRTRASGQWKQFFTPGDLEIYRRRWSEQLKSLGYDDWVLEPAPSLDPAEHSEYLERLRDEALDLARRRVVRGEGRANLG